MRAFSLFPNDRPVPRLPLLGHAPAMRQDALRLFTRLAKEQGGIARLQIGPQRAFLVSEPSLVGEVFVRRKSLYSRTTRIYHGMKAFLGESILTVEGTDWRVHRRIVQPAFHKRRLSSFSDGIVRISKEELAGWRGELDVSEEMMRVTLRIVSEVLLGSKTEADSIAIGSAIDNAQRYLEDLMASVVPRPSYLPTASNRRLKRAIEVLDRVAYKMIDTRMASGERGDDVVSMLLDATYEDGTPLPRERIRNELITLLSAGHETTSNALSWTLMLLSRHPDVARRLEREVHEVLGDRDPSFDDVSKLTYTRWVFDEAMRLHPPVWVTGRLAEEAHELGGLNVAEGDLILLSPHTTHRRPDLWENPEGFDPQRWEKLSVRGALPPFTYYPFGGGTRKCVGEAFAYLEATLLLAMIAQRMRLDLVPGHPIQAAPQLTQGLAGGLPMRVVPRAASAELTDP